MTSDIRLAFAHPEERAAASASADPRDRISLRDHVVEVEIGAFQQERGTRQRVQFNVVVEVRPQPQPLNDDVDKILSYDTITDAIAFELAAERLNLLETLAERSRAEAPLQAISQDGVEQALHPLVVYLDNAGIAAADLGARLDALQARGVPVILTVGLPDLPRPQTGHKPTQRRIDLLAIEQNAWVLAARDDRCVVVETRTEIDWAVKNGQMIVWAPSKLVLDAVDGPQSREPVVLALWLAELMAATGLVVHGNVALPAGSRVVVERA
jgi:dihydroneopterin aldolase